MPIYDSPIFQSRINHPIHNVIDLWINKLIAEKPGHVQTDPSSRAAFFQLLLVLRKIKASMGESQLIYYSPNQLQNLHNQINALQGPWNNFKASNSHAQGLSNHTDGIIQHSAFIGFVTNSNRSFAQYVENWEQEHQTAQEKSGKWLAELEKSQEKISSELQATEKSISQANAAIEKQKQRLDALIEKHGETFLSHQEERSKEFKGLLEEINSEFKEYMEQAALDSSTSNEAAESEYAKLQTQIKSLSEKLVEEITGQKEKAKELVGFIMTTSMAGNYQKIAKREFWSAWGMRGLALASFVIMVILLIGVGKEISAATIDWKLVVFRTSFSALVLIPGFYCAKESTKHMQSEIRHRKIALEMAALDPYLSQLEEAKRKEILAKKVDDYFGESSICKEIESGNLDLSNLNMSAEQFLKIAGKVLDLAVKK